MYRRLYMQNDGVLIIRLPKAMLRELRQHQRLTKTTVSATIRRLVTEELHPFTADLAEQGNEWDERELSRAIKAEQEQKL